MKILQNEFRSGFVSIIGKPNAGKSTLMNYLTGEKIAIVSHKPQTTRNRIQGVLTTEEYQAVFIDTPGLHEPKSKLGKYMVKNAKAALDDADIILFLTEADNKNPEKDFELFSRLNKTKTPVLLIINKIDKIPRLETLAVIEKFKTYAVFKEIIPLSALTGENTEELVKVIRAYLPEGPKYFQDDYLTDQPERQIISEIIREKALFFLQEEIPHGIAVETTKVKRKKKIFEVEATIYCEKESHKGIIIGKQGLLLKKIGQKSRPEIEKLLGSQVFLQTWVKIKKNWRDNDFTLKTLGYG